jgi:hypothetical protein
MVPPSLHKADDMATCLCDHFSMSYMAMMRSLWISIPKSMGMPKT